MPTLKLLHNPRCSKSRLALNILLENKVQFEVIEYLKQPLDLEQITQLYNKLACNSVIDMMRTNEPAFRQASLSKASAQDILLKAMVDYPILIERPIIYDTVRAVIGRPPERVSEFLDGSDTND